MVLYGYGRILEIDLSTGKIVKKDIDPKFARQFIGGMGFSCKIIYDEVRPDVDPFGPDNMVIFANGPLTGTHVPCAGRTEITTMSPLTGRMGTGNTGGVWGAYLKHAGYEMVIVRGKAEKPVYLWIDDDVVEIREASKLWGKDAKLTADILREELGSSQPSKVSVLAIGPAGENLVKFSCSLNDYHHVAGRNGSGAVMGAKKLKAIAVRGSNSIQVAQPEELKKVAKEARERLLACIEALQMPGSGVAMSLGYVERVKQIAALGSLPGKNFQTGVIPQIIETRGRDESEKYYTRKDGTCYACPVSCFNLVELKEGKYAGLKVSRGTAPGIIFDWGAKCAIDNLPGIWKCKELCQHLGLDYGSAAGAISFTMELYERGIITKEDTDGLELTFGNEDAAVRMLNKIAVRDGFGDILAEGTVRAAKRIGKGAERYVMATKGVEIMSMDPRSGSRGWVTGDLTEPRGGDNLKSTHFVADFYNPNWWVDKFDMPEDVKQKIYCTPPEEVTTSWEGKAMMCKWFQDVYSIMNSLGVCFRPAAQYIAWGPTYLSRLFSACTGWDTTPQDIMTGGERIFNLYKSHHVRNGQTRKDDTWPDRFFEEPLPEGIDKGAVLSRETIDTVLDEYYELRGWDIKTGTPTAQKLGELGLSDIADDLVKRGKI